MGKTGKGIYIKTDLSTAELIEFILLLNWSNAWVSEPPMPTFVKVAF
jgi:hypothetical protein